MGSIKCTIMEGGGELVYLPNIKNVQIITFNPFLQTPWGRGKILKYTSLNDAQITYKS